MSHINTAQVITPLNPSRQYHAMSIDELITHADESFTAKIIDGDTLTIVRVYKIKRRFYVYKPILVYIFRDYHDPYSDIAHVSYPPQYPPAEVPAYDHWFYTKSLDDYIF